MIGVIFHYNQCKKIDKGQINRGGDSIVVLKLLQWFATVKQP